MTEKQRLARLREYNILDTPPEEEFDAITRLAARICDTPVAMINFIDENRQWTKSSVGVEVDEVIQENSFCSHTIQQDHEMIIEDLSDDYRFSEHPYVQNPPNFRFYAGINIQSPGNHNLGTLCVLDKKERQITKKQKENLKYLAEEISTRLELRRKRSRLEEQNIELQDQSRFLKNATDLMLQIDPQTGLIIEAHTGDNDIIGFSESELIKKSLFEVFEEIEPEEKLRRWMLDADRSDKFQQEVLFKTKDGQTLWCKINAARKDDRVYLTARDISDKHEAREKLVAESQMNKQLIHNLPGIFCLTDRDGKLVNWNKNFLKKGNYSEEYLRENRECEHYFLLPGKQKVKHLLNTVFEEGEMKTECKLKTSDGKLIPVLLSGFSVEYTGKRQAVAIAIDQSKQKEVENKLSDEKRRFKLATNVASDVIWDRDFDNEDIWWSEGLSKNFGYQRSTEEYGVNWWKTKVHPDDRERVIDGLERFFASTESYWSDEYRFEKADGSYAYVRDSAYAIRDDRQQTQRLIGAMVDETDRIEAQQELKNALKSLNKAHEIAQLGYYEWIPGEDILKWSDRVLQIYGLTDREAPFEVADYIELVHPDDRAKVKEMVSTITDGENVTNLVHRIITPNGTLKYIQQRINVITDQQGKVELISGTAQDVTREVEQRKKLQRFSKVATETSNLVVITNAEGKTEWVNESFQEVTGYTLEEIKGQKPGELLQGPDTDPETIQHLSDKIEKAEPVNAEIKNYTKAGDPYWLEVSIDPVFNENGELIEFFAIQKDISERKQYEIELQESLNENEVLLSEIHHRVKNNMAIISGLLQLEAMRSKDEELQSKMRKSQMRIQSMAMVHEKLYQSEDFSNLSFGKYVNQLIGSIKSTYGLSEKGITLDTAIDSIQMNINQAVSCGLLIHELVTNVVKHGFKLQNNESGKITVQVTREGDDVQISLIDNGYGVPEEFRFEDKDTLGATLVETLRKQLKADITISSDEITEFKITFELDEGLQGSAANADLSHR